MTSKITQLKEFYIKYFQDVPVQKYAAMYIGRDEDTIIRWRQSDTKFAESIQRAKAEWIRKRLLATKAEFALERLEKNVFSPKMLDERDYSAGIVIYRPERYPRGYDGQAKQPQ
ncbi:hypothetical protein HYW36_02700 [Candidatus Saccharibacteria bacterium]|nr:hypothetical protein [Candidatus Saccharibacteria bacterium]